MAGGNAGHNRVRKFSAEAAWQCDLDHINPPAFCGIRDAEHNEGMHMRTHILIAALLLATTAAHAGPRSLSGAQESPIPSPAQAAPLEAPVYKVLSSEPSAAPAKPAEQPRTSAQQSVEPKPAQAAPIVEQPAIAKPAEAKPVETAPVAAQPVEAKPVETTTVEAKRSVQAKPLRHARRKHQRNQDISIHIPRELRNIERNIGAIGSALTLVSSFYYW